MTLVAVLIGTLAYAALALGLIGVAQQSAQYNGGGVIHAGCHFSAYYDRHYQLIISRDVLCYERAK